MNGRYLLLALVLLSGSLLAYDMLSDGEPGQREAASRLSVDETDAMRAAAKGVWRSPKAATAAEPAESAAATEVVTIPAAQFQTLVQRNTAAPDNRGSVTFALQRELARVGCYDGEINGAYTTATRQAMKAFMDRVNATLPINQPDPVLLTLVRNHDGKVCGAPCPLGQEMAGDGRCMFPAVRSAVKPKETNEPASSISNWSTVTTVTPGLPSSLSEGQMSLAGPKPETDPNALPTKPVATSAPRPRVTRGASGGDWRAELWKRQN
jgi:peptidoglycan hydrolase-like protein with peptidoglycan-binding domain